MSPSVPANAGNIKVVVRCRPLNARESSRGAKCLVRMEGNQTYLDPPEASNVSSGRAFEKETKSFTFDKSYWSAGPKDGPRYASQQTLYEDLGRELLDTSFEGFNTCIFAYGQTGSGKSYSMMGYGEDRGIIPLICEALFTRIGQLQDADANLTCTVEVSYTEIYQEKVRDLLNPGNKGALRVREHLATGPYVEGLSQLAVQSFADIEALMDEGTKARTVAATNMNETSSRSHAVFTLVLTQRRQDTETGMAGEKVSKISLVDLAGSERANATGATGQRLKEGALINKSLTTLGRVIAALAASSAAPAGSRKAAADKVPYRDSVLTWLLKESLGGNSKTYMIAAISPADYEETLSTLRYADQAKKIKTKAVVNEDPNAKLIRELKDELATLRSRMAGGATEAMYDEALPPERQMVQYRTKTGEIKTVSKAELQDQLEASERLMASVQETWEQKLERTQVVQREREQALEALGITIEKNEVGVHAPKKMPHLVNLNEDPLMSECLIYQIKDGKTFVGNVDSASSADIRLSGSTILPEHCYFLSEEGKVSLHATHDSLTMVNGHRVAPSKPRELKSGYRIILGDFHIFRFNNPEEVRRLRDAGQTRAAELRSPRVSGIADSPRDGASTPVSVATPDEVVDWSFARREAVVARLNGKNVDLDRLDDGELDNLYDSILKVKHSRTGTASLATSDRPDSRLSLLDDDDDDATSGGSPLGRRPFSYGSTYSTERTTADSTITLRDPPEVEEKIQIVKEEYEERIRTLQEATSSSEGAERQQMELKLESLQSELRLQTHKYEQRVRQLSALVPARRGPLTPSERRLAAKAIEVWRGHQRVRMAEDALSKAILLKEANVISRELAKETVYQFVVVERPLEASAADAIMGLDDDVTESFVRLPCVAVKVLDYRSTAAYIWTLSKFEQRLHQMRDLYKFIDRPRVSQHLSWAEPFYEESTGFSLLGSATFSLAPILRSVAMSATCQIYSAYMAESIGSCRVRLKPLGRIGKAKEPSFELVIDSVAGPSHAEHDSSHMQLRCGDDILVSEVVDSVSLSQMRLKHTFTGTLSNDSFATVDFFSRITHAHLDRILAWDEARDAQRPAATREARKNETELLNEQTHDILTWIDIVELGAGGTYEPTPVVSNHALDSGAFHLHQGLQRRVVLTLSHNSGHAWEWRQVQSASLGNVRLLDSRGRIHASERSMNVDLRPIRDALAHFSDDGHSSIVFEAAWDSSMHDSIFLNRVTGSGDRVLLELTWTVLAEGTPAPLEFSTDIALTMQNRDARPPSKFATFLSSTRVLSRVSTLFNVRLTPLLTKRSDDIWRLNTAESYVRGEDILSKWRPRGVTLVRDYENIRRERTLWAELEACRALYEAYQLTLPPVELDETTLTSKALSLWQRRFGTTAEVALDQQPVLTAVRELDDAQTPTLERPPMAPRKLTARVSSVPRNGYASRRGYLAVLRDPSSNAWRKHWFVLRRPYLFAFKDATETDEATGPHGESGFVINLERAKVERGPEIDSVLQRRNAFALFTHQNSYFFQAPNPRELEAWLRAIDPSHSLPAQDDSIPS